MNATGVIGPETLGVINILTLIFDLAIKSTLLVCAAGLVALLLRRRSSATTIGLLWTFTIAAVVLLPAFIIVTPQLSVPLVPDISTWLRSQESEFAASVFESEKPPAFNRSGSDSLRFSGSVAEDGQGATAGASFIPELHWSAWIALVCLAGSALLLVWRLIGRGVLYWIRRKAVPLGNAQLTRLLEKETAEMGLKRRISILRSNITTVAFASGIWHTALILPAEAGEWDEDRLRMVLLHELAHVKRGDLLFELLAQLATALYWFNPLVWLAAYRLRVERERACDDSVINTGVRQSEYATQLLTVASDMEVVRQPLWQAATISQGASLKNRLLCILSPKRRRSTRQGFAAVLIGLVVVLLALPLAAFNPWQKSPTEEYLHQAGGERLLSLLGDLRNPDSQVRMQAVWSLGKIEDEKAVRALRSALDDNDSGVRSSAINNLAARGDAGSIPYFVDSLLDSDYRIRAAAALAVVKLLGHEKGEIREIVMKNLILQAGGKQRVFALLVSAIGNCAKKERIEASGNLMKALIIYYPKEEDFRLLAMKTLADHDEPLFYFAFCIPIHKDKSENNRIFAVARLAKLKIKNADVYEALTVGLLKDKSAKVRAMAARAFGEIGDFKAEGVLKKAVRDSDPSVRKEAEIALKKLQMLQATD